MVTSMTTLESAPEAHPRGQAQEAWPGLPGKCPPSEYDDSTLTRILFSSSQQPAKVMAHQLLPTAEPDPAARIQAPQPPHWETICKPGLVALVFESHDFLSFFQMGFLLPFIDWLVKLHLCLNIANSGFPTV